MPAGPNAGPAALAGELLSRVRAELPVVDELGEREAAPRVGVAYRTALGADPRRLRRRCGDLAGWPAGRGPSALAAGRVHVDLWAATQLD